MKKALRINFLAFDLFGSNISLCIKNQQQHRTLYGAAISILIFLFVGYSFTLLIIDMYYNQSPNVISIERFVPNPEKFELKPEDYFFAINVVDGYGIPILQSDDSTIYTAEAEHCHRYSAIKDGQAYYQSDCYTFYMVPCQDAHLNQNLMDVTYPINYKVINPPKQLFNLMYCIDNQDWREKGIVLQGTGQSLNFQTLNLKVKPCVNNTLSSKGKVCSSQSTIDQTLQSGYVAISFPDRILNEQTPSNPYETVNQLLIASITNTLYNNKNLMVYLRHSITYTFQNYFYYQTSTMKDTALIYNRFQESIETTGKQQILGCLFMLDDKQINYQRSYYNILHVLGNIGGLMNLLLFLGRILISPLSKMSLDLLMVNQIFQFRNVIPQSRANPTPRKQQMRDTTVGFLQDLNQVQDKQKFKVNLHYLKGFFKFKLGSLYLGLQDYLMCFCQRDRRMQIKEGVEKLNQKLDAIFLINKLIEIDKLKRLLLNEDQLRLFDYIPKPQIVPPSQLAESNVITGDEAEPSPGNSTVAKPRLSGLKLQTKINQRQEFEVFRKEKPFITKVQEAFEAYKKLSGRHDQDEVSQKLISFMDEEIRILFDQTMEVLAQHKRLSDGQLSNNPGPLSNCIYVGSMPQIPENDEINQLHDFQSMQKEWSQQH